MVRTKDAGAGSFRVADVIGLASVLLGFAWIEYYGTGSPVVVLVAGAVVGVLYSNRQISAHRAGARVGVLAPIPEVVMQVLWPPGDVLLLDHGGGALAFSVAAVGLVAALGWLLGAVVCIVTAAAAGWVTERARRALGRKARSPS